MDCRQTSDYVQSWLDGELAGEALAAWQDHLDRCPSCRAEVADWEALHQALRRLPAPAPPPDLAARLGAGHAAPRRRGWALAVAASLVLALIAGAFLLPVSWRPTPGQEMAASLRLAVNSSKTIQLSLSSPRDLEQVELTLVLPENLALEGYPRQQVISWKTHLLAGDNRLSLPVKAKAVGEGDLIARIEYAGTRKELRVHVTTRPAPIDQSLGDPKRIPPGSAIVRKPASRTDLV